jgi:hypothetical protein
MERRNVIVGVIGRGGRDVSERTAGLSRRVSRGDSRLDERPANRGFMRLRPTAS